MLDLFIVLAYFTVIMVLALRGKVSSEANVEAYFLSNRNLRWPSIAISTIATNVQGYQFLGMMGSAYLFGLAQASLEINAMQGILMAAFIFVPMYLREKVVTITQFIKTKLGATVALLYSAASILLFSTITLGAALFWGAYAADQVFGEYLSVISEDRMIRIAVVGICLGVFAAFYTYLGGLAAVVKTDIFQFAILFIGGLIVLFIAIHHLGGWGQLYAKTPEMMHLHLPADHPKLPWTHVFGLFLLNINYWCANQSVMQRSLAAKNLKEAQIGLMVGGVMKYAMAAIIVIPGIALYGILGDQGLAEPDLAFPYLINNYIPVGLKGVILCALFASLMSTVDSTFNSISTLWSIDIYKQYINKSASEQKLVAVGKQTILVTLITGITMSIILLVVKFKNPEAAFTHTLNELRYFINCGIVVLICACAFLKAPQRKLAIAAFLLTVPLQFIILYVFPDMNYFVRAGWVIVIAFCIVGLPALPKGWKSLRELFVFEDTRVAWVGLALALSLGALHFTFG